MGSVIVIGAGLAGSEAALQLASRGFNVELYEMRPLVMTPAHRSGYFAELVCSNSLKSESPTSASYLLKEELRMLGSFLLSVAKECQVPAGHALAVDRECFSKKVTDLIKSNPRIHCVELEVRELPLLRPLIIATGPLTSHSFAEALKKITTSSYLYFFDAISPIVSADSIDCSVVFQASRYNKGGEDYLNCPMTKEEYLRFYNELITAEVVELRDFERGCFFEACLPIEEIARRGVDTLRFGPMKPVGLIDPRVGKQPYAVVQLRKENLHTDAYNLVGFQNHLRFSEQKRVFRLITGLEKAEFVRYGQMHRNTYINAPKLLNPTLELKKMNGVFVAGQLCGLEGYVEAIATGLLSALQVIRYSCSKELLLFPENTAIGSLQRVIKNSPAENYQPINITFSIIPPVEEGPRKRHLSKKERHKYQIERALDEITSFIYEKKLI